jgi:CYTH domain-containing protein
MGTEIERKFLVDTAQWSPSGSGTHIVQGYLSSHPERVVRVRIAGAHAKLTVKGKNEGISRIELEYDVPIADAQQMLAMCERPLIDKHRHEVRIGPHTWEVDIFHGDNDGLVLAEIELTDVDATFVKPPWAGKDVSDDARYYNSNLMKAPYKSWNQP